ncbi:DUF2599 domain-containing protein [Pseudomonas sp. NPDC088368]|uniref:DUF2599 domain-containing protein n=1 Tax=Pseudomonas sp. NPDC088368 TaxID=3364453 RepID=UPI00381221AD
MKKPQLWAVSLVALAMQAPYVLAASCADTAKALTAQYNDTRDNCGKNTSPAFLCNGVIFRATVPSDDYSSWDPSPNSVKSGGTSFSYLRKDAKFSRLVRYENNGYILFPVQNVPPGKSTYNVLCAFPMDGGTDAREDKGCGAWTGSKPSGQGAPCYSQQPNRITTGQEWADHYKAFVNGDNRRECGFDVRDNLNSYAVDNFNASLSAQRRTPEAFRKQNELRLDTWKSTTPAGELPIQAFFYLPEPTGGRDDAQFDQQRYYEKTGVWVPVIAMTLPSRLSDDATFKCNADDQAVAESGKPIDRYVKSATWVPRFDPGTGQNEWSLSVVLTDLGRKQSGSAGSDAVYAELVRKYKNDYQWKQNGGVGMRRQLVCHFVIARGKDEFNLEPFRPDATEAEAERAGCNVLPSDLTAATQ